MFALSGEYARAVHTDDLCPMCGRKLVIGVLHRVEQLADRKLEDVPKDVIPFTHLVPLEEIIGEALGVGRDTAGVARVYDALVKEFGSEFEVLMKAPLLLSLRTLPWP